LRKLSKKNLSEAELAIAIDAWEKAKKLRVKNHAMVADQAECMRIFSRGHDMDGALALISELEVQTGSIKLMTGHRSKGLETDTVFILDRQLINVEKQEQDANLLYVMQTRAKEKLVYVRSDNFVGEGIEE
jgi:ATP-dependent exoDNAse (exonuclease V) beta subunit